MKVRVRVKWLLMLALGSLAAALVMLSTAGGRLLIQRALLLDQGNQLCVGQLSMRIGRSWLVESLPRDQGWKALLVNPLEAVSRGQADTWSIHLSDPAGSQRLIISRLDDGIDWVAWTSRCRSNSHCQLENSPFFKGQDQPALVISGVNQKWYQHEFQRLLVAVHGPGTSTRPDMDLPQMGQCSGNPAVQ